MIFGGDVDWKVSPSWYRAIFRSVQNSIRFDKNLSGAHKYRESSVQFRLLAAASNSVAFMGHLSTGYTLNR